MVKKSLIALALLVTFGVVMGGIFGGQSQPSGAPPDPHADLVLGAQYGCEKFVRANSRMEVKEVIRTYELTGKKLTNPKTEAWVGLDYRAGSDGRLMWAACHYGLFGDGLALMDHDSGAR